MKSKLILFVILTSLLFTFGCDRVEEFSGVDDYHQTVWMVVRAEHSNSHFCGYRLLPISPGRVNAQDTWICDSVGKFNIGDSLVFSKINK